MDTSVLEELGLSKGEIKVYLTLLELGSTKIGGVIEKSGMASSAAHNSINSLIGKGLVSYIKKGKIKFYQAAPLRQIANFIEEKKRKFLELVPELELKQTLAKEKQEAEVFEGTKGLMAMLNKFIEDTKKGDKYYFFGTYFKGSKEQTEKAQKFFKQYDLKRKEKGLFVYGLAPKELKEYLIGRKRSEIKYTDLPLPHGIGICKDRLTLFSWSDKPVGYLIKSKQIAEMFREYFNSLWKIAKK